MKIKNKGKTGLKQKFISKATPGDVIKVHYVQSDNMYHLLLITTLEPIGEYALVNLDENLLTIYKGSTLSELYDNIFLVENTEVINSLKVYKKPVLTI